MSFVTDSFGFLVKGGWVMIPLILCAIVAVATAIERYVAIGKAAADNEALLDNIRIYLNDGRISEALELCESHRGVVASLIASGIRNRHLDTDSIERAMEELALRETPILYKRLGILDTIITLAPLLGLLGTITGMMRTFNVMASSANAAPFRITGGIGEALIATATGLTIAICTLPIYNYLTERVKEIISEMEVRATQLLNIMATMREREGRPGEAAKNRA